MPGKLLLCLLFQSMVNQVNQVALYSLNQVAPPLTVANGDKTSQ